MAKSVLHEKIAVREGLRGKVTKVCGDLLDLFRNKRQHFSRELTVYRPIKEGEKTITEKDTPLNTTVPRELAWLLKEVTPLIDLQHTISRANGIAVADIVLCGRTVAEKVPATSLLDLRKVLVTQIKPVLEAIPTLDPVKGFVLDRDQGEGIYKAKTRESARTQAEPYPVIMAPATDKFAAQVKEATRHITVGYKTDDEWSGMLTPAEKSDLLSRFEQVVAAVDEATARANMVEVTGEKIAEPLLDFIIKQPTQ